MRLTVYMDPYGRFFISDRRGAYPVEVELADEYRVLEDSAGKRTLVGPKGSGSEITEILQSGGARIL